MLDDLHPDTAYEGRLRDATLEAALSFRTLRPLRDGRMVSLRPAGTKAEGTRLVGVGQHLVAIWREEFAGRDHQIAGMHSEDGGQTWSAPIALCDRGEWAGEPALTACGDGVAAAWAGGTTGSNRIWLRLFSAGDGRWQPPTMTHDLALAQTPLLECQPEGGGRVTACDVTGHFSSAAFDRTGRPSGPREPGFALEPGVDCWGLLRLGGQRLVLFQRDSDDRQKKLFWSTAPSAIPGTWTSPRPLCPEPARTPTAVVRGDRLATAFVTEKKVFTCLFDSTLRPLSAGKPALPEQTDGRVPALAATHSGLLLAFADVAILSARIDLVLATSADGLSWSGLHRVLLPVSRVRELCVAESGGLAQVLVVATTGELLLVRLPMAAEGR